MRGREAAPPESARIPRRRLRRPIHGDLVDDAIRRVAREDAQILKALAAFDRGERPAD